MWKEGNYYLVWFHSCGMRVEWAHVHWGGELRDLSPHTERSGSTVAPRSSGRMNVARLRRSTYELLHQRTLRSMPRKLWSFCLLTYDVSWIMLLGRLLFYIHFGLVFHVVICFKDSVGKLQKVVLKILVHL